MAGAVVAHPQLILVLCVVLTLDLLVGPARLLLGGLAVAVVLGTLRLARPASFTRWVGAPVRSHWRCWWHYRRHWQPVMATTGLTTVLAGTEYVPRLRRVVCTTCVDSALVGLLAGQAPADYEDQVEELAHTFRALSCRVRVDRPGRVWLDFAHTDPLAQPIPALSIPDVPDLSLLLDLGAPPHVVCEIVGHTDLGVTMMIYAHASQEDKRTALGRLDDRLR